MRREVPYNPLDKQNLGVSVADALLRREREPLPPKPFLGAGVYAIYYAGDFPLYAPIAARNLDPDNPLGQPIYVGKAIPAGARRGDVGLDEPPGAVLHSRLREHAKSIDQAENLDLARFTCRYLAVEDIWIPLGESLLISGFRPLWNSAALDGYGIHDPGKGRYNQAPSAWDILHPGRPWVAKLTGAARTQDAVAAAVGAFLAEQFPDEPGDGEA